jgi:hypothetical protein
LIFGPKRWELSNPAGLKITSESATHCFWWKAFLPNALKRQGLLGTQDVASETKREDDSYIEAGLVYVFREIYGYFLRHGLIVGNPPDYHKRFGKMTILGIASDYFRTPYSVAGWNLPLEIKNLDQHIVAKSLASEPTSNGKVTYTTSIEYRSIDRNFPWFIQSRVDTWKTLQLLFMGSIFFVLPLT